MLDFILNPSLEEACVMLACLAIGIYAGVNCWWASSNTRRQLQADQAAADTRARSRAVREELYNA